MLLKLLVDCFCCIYIILFLYISRGGSIVNAENGLRKPNQGCGGVLTEPRGTIQTPDFPKPFRVPIKCKWVVEVSTEFENTSTVIYLTQLFVTTGLKFTEYPYYDASFPAIGGQVIHSVTEKNVTTVAWIQSRANFIVIDFELQTLEGNHLRAMNNLLDVFGFNITYETRHNVDDPLRYPICSIVACSLDGHCYANENYTEYWCSCFSGFYGSDCGQGPLCLPERNLCENNATCRHAGATAVFCDCPPSYTGPRCETFVPLLPNLPECNGDDCALQCPYKQNQPPCSCTENVTLAPVGFVRYLSVLHLAHNNGTTEKESFKLKSNRTLINQLEKQITRFLKNNQVYGLNDLKVTNITIDGEVEFYFVGEKTMGKKIRDALSKLIENRRIGNINLASNQLTFIQEPTLFLQDVMLNHKTSAVRFGDEFTLSCIARGSPHMTFTWLKDGVIVNESRALRNIWTKLLPLDMKERYTALLGIKHADVLDKGHYSCQVTDRELEQCKSIVIDVIPPPIVSVTPMSVTLEKGQNLTILCMWHNEGSLNERVYGYSWFKEFKDSKDAAHLFKIDRNKEIWEDLHPAGSILKIYNIQKSSRYTCQVQSNVYPVNASVDIEVLNKSAIPWCPTDDAEDGGEVWMETRAWGLAKAECPNQYTGVATRLCSLVDPGQTQWQIPDYSNCVSNRFTDLSRNFRSLTLGYQTTTAADTVSGLLGYLRDKPDLYPGEGESALALLQNISHYLYFASAYDDLVQSTPFFFSTINTLLERENAIVNSQKIVDLQNLVNKWALHWSNHIGGSSTDSGYLSFDSLVVDVFSSNLSSVIENTLDKTNSFHIPRSTISYPRWFKTSIDVFITPNGLETNTNSSYSIAVIVYKDLLSYLPRRLIYKKDDGCEMEYEVASNIVSVVFNSPLDATIDISFPVKIRPGWNISCGVMSATWTQWLLDKCLLKVTNIESNMTVCSCKTLGSFTTLITKQVRLHEYNASPRSNSIVLIGCICCLIQCLFTIALLMIRWYHNPTCIIFLKLQCCLAIVATMAIFSLATRAIIKQSDYPYLMTCLEVFITIGLSSQLSKFLLVYTELVYLPKPKFTKQILVCIITGSSLLVVFCNYLAHNVMGWNLTSWWLISGTLLYYMCIVFLIFLSTLFVFLYFAVVSRLKHIAKSKSIHVTTSKAIKKRIDLLKRAALIYLTTICMVSSSIYYVNFPGITHSHYLFSFSCTILGSVVLVCYVVCSESTSHLRILEKLNLDFVDVYSSSSDSNPLSFFTKQNGEVENDSAPPFKKETTKETCMGSASKNDCVQAASVQSLNISTPPIITDQLIQPLTLTNSDDLIKSQSDLVTGQDL